MPGTEPRASEKREQFEKQAQSLNTGNRASDRPSERHILVCGWRKKWTDNGVDFGHRIEDLTVKLKGTKSSVTFLNNLDVDTFCDVMRAANHNERDGEKLGGDWPDLDVKVWDMGGEDFAGIKIRFVRGDASDETKLLPILQKWRIDTAVVLGSHATAIIPPKSRDTRVLTTMLVLRHALSKIPNGPDKKDVHIVGENEIDLTAQLALAPRKTKSAYDKPSDFVNTQAIQARVLVQTLAFPQLNASVSELFNGGGANVQIYEADQFLPLGIEMSFGAVQQMMVLKEEYRTIICMGFIDKDGTATCMPALPGKGEKPRNPNRYEQVRKYTAGEQLICIVRELFSPPEKARGCGLWPQWWPQ
jgi:hypothetical protein